MTRRASGGRRPRTNVVLPASSFVGRDAELASLSALWGEARLVTLLGPGGMGKTRLALRHCEERLPTYTARGGGGVWFVDLSEVRSVAGALAAIAGVLDVALVGLSTDDAIALAIGRGIARRGRVMIVLDNLEPVAEQLAPCVDRWVRTAPSARVLVTSRVAMGLDAEHVLPVGPLTRGDAMDLFIGRARLVRAGAELEDREATAEIVDAIDRMPLAIELAASRMRVLSTADLRVRLERPLEVLRRGSSDGDRHGSVRRAVLDSVELLPPSARRSFGLASILKNGFTLADAEAVLGDGALPRGEVLDTLDALTRTSLLRVLTSPGEPSRFAFFETIREVAEALAAEDPAREAVLAAHSSHYARRAAALGPRADRELENLLRAHGTAVRLASERRARDRAEDAVEIAVGLEPVLSARGLSRLRAALFADTLAALEATDTAAPEVRARAHLGRGLALRELGETARARDDFELALVLAEAARDDGLSAVALTHIGGVCDLAGDTAGARSRLETALVLLARTERGEVRTRREAEAQLLLGHAHRREGDLAEARRNVEGAVTHHRALDHGEGLAAALYELAVIEMFAGRAREALNRFDEGLAVARRAGVRLMEGALTTARGCLLQELGQVSTALEHHAEAARIFAELASRYREASALLYLATAYLERDEPEEALAVLAQARRRLEAVGSPRYEALIAAVAATALATLEREGEAERELAQAESALTRVPREPALEAAVTVHRWLADVRAGRRDGEEALSSGERLVAERPSDDSRFALRALRALVRGSTASVVRRELVVWPDGSAFALPGSSERVPLPARSPLRRILEHLVTCRLESPGEVVSIDDIVVAGWPGEKIGTDAALNRAYVAMSSLRKKGLRGVLLTSAGGYALSRAVLVRRVPESAAPGSGPSVPSAPRRE